MRGAPEPVEWRVLVKLRIGPYEPVGDRGIVAAILHRLHDARQVPPDTPLTELEREVGLLEPLAPYPKQSRPERDVVGGEPRPARRLGAREERSHKDEFGHEAPTAILLRTMAATASAIDSSETAAVLKVAS